MSTLLLRRRNLTSTSSSSSRGGQERHKKEFLNDNRRMKTSLRGVNSNYNKYLGYSRNDDQIISHHHHDENDNTSKNNQDTTTTTTTTRTTRIRGRTMRTPPTEGLRWSFPKIRTLRSKEEATRAQLIILSALVLLTVVAILITVGVVLQTIRRDRRRQEQYQERQQKDTHREGGREDNGHKEQQTSVFVPPAVVNCSVSDLSSSLDTSHPSSLQAERFRRSNTTQSRESDTTLSTSSQVSSSNLSIYHDASYRSSYGGMTTTSRGSSTLSSSANAVVSLSRSSGGVPIYCVAEESSPRRRRRGGGFEIGSVPEEEGESEEPSCNTTHQQQAALDSKTAETMAPEDEGDKHTSVAADSHSNLGGTDLSSSIVQSTLATGGSLSRNSRGSQGTEKEVSIYWGFSIQYDMVPPDVVFLSWFAACWVYRVLSATHWDQGDGDDACRLLAVSFTTSTVEGFSSSPCSSSHCLEDDGGDSLLRLHTLNAVNTEFFNDLEDTFGDEEESSVPFDEKDVELNDDNGACLSSSDPPVMVEKSAAQNREASREEEGSIKSYLRSLQDATEALHCDTMESDDTSLSSIFNVGKCQQKRATVSSLESNVNRDFHVFVSILFAQCLAYRSQMRVANPYDKSSCQQEPAVYDLIDHEHASVLIPFVSSPLHESGNDDPTHRPVTGDTNAPICFVSAPTPGNNCKYTRAVTDTADKMPDQRSHDPDSVSSADVDRVRLAI